MDLASTPPADAAPAAELPVMDSHSPLGDPRILLAAGMVAIVALVTALYFARAFFIPLLIGILASYSLHPLVDWLGTLRIPRSIGAALVLALLVGGFGLLMVKETVDELLYNEKRNEVVFVKYL